MPQAIKSPANQTSVATHTSTSHWFMKPSHPSQSIHHPTDPTTPTQLHTNPGTNHTTILQQTHWPTHPHQSANTKPFDVFLVTNQPIHQHACQPTAQPSDPPNNQPICQHQLPTHTHYIACAQHPWLSNQVDLLAVERSVGDGVTAGWWALCLLSHTRVKWMHILRVFSKADRNVSARPLSCVSTTNLILCHARRGS